jgi:hypothetical protein
MHATAQFCFNCMQLCHHAFLRRFPPDDERPTAPALPAVVRKAQERKGFRLPFTTFLPILGSEPPKLDQSRFLRMQFQSELGQLFPKCFQKSLGFHSVFEAYHQVIAYSQKTRPRRCPDPEIIALRRLMMNQEVFGRFPASLIYDMNRCADREPIAVCPVNPYAASLSTPPHASSHTLEIQAAAPYPRHGGIFAFCSSGLARLAHANRAIFTAQGCCESIGSGRIGRKLAVGNTSEKAGSLKMLRTRRPQVSDNSLPQLTLMIVSVGFLPSGCAGGKGGRRPPMPRRGDDGPLPNVSVEQELQVVDNQLMEGRYIEVGHHFPGKAGD